MQFKDNELINEGSYGKVYKSLDNFTGKYYAIKERKFYKKEENYGIPKDILREIVLLKKLDHINIVKPIQVEIDNKEKIYRVVLEYFEHDLLDFINIYRVSSHKIPLKSIKYIIKQLLCGIEYLHSNMIVHRDLKPSNILITKDLHLTIADFGFAKQINIPLRTMSKYVGTLTYRAPELLINQEVDYGPSIDIWSIGCILINLLLKDKFVDANDENTLLLKLIRIIGEERFAKSDIYQGFIKDIKKLSLQKERFQLENLKDSLGEEGYDFICKLIEPDPIIRIEAIEALKHSWIAE